MPSARVAVAKNVPPDFVESFEKRLCSALSWSKKSRLAEADLVSGVLGAWLDPVPPPPPPPLPPPPLPPPPPEGDVDPDSILRRLRMRMTRKRKHRRRSRSSTDNTPRSMVGDLRLAQQTLVDSPCPHPPKPKPKSVSDATGRVDDSGGAGVDEAEHANDASIVSRKAEMQARVLALLCEMNAVIAPLLLADGVDKDALDLRGALMARFQDDWMYANELKEMFDEGAFSDVLDSNASGSSALGEVESAIRVILVGLLDYDDDYVAFMAKKAEE